MNNYSNGKDGGSHNRKSVETDNISPEMVKYAAKSGTKTLGQIFNMAMKEEKYQTTEKLV